MKLVMTIFTGICTLLIGTNASASDFDTSIPMRAGNATTFYVKAAVGNLVAVDFMVDTGSGYTTINEATLVELQRNKQAKYLHDLVGVLANGTEMLVPVYRLSSFNIGGDCHINNVEAAVFPGKTRQILGLSVLKQTAPFIFSLDPPKLVLSNCANPDVLASIEG